MVKRQEKIFIIAAAVLCLITAGYVLHRSMRDPFVGSFADETAIGQNKPLLLEFSSQKCDPCRQMFPIMEQLRDEYSELFTVAYVDILQSGDIAAKYGVADNPTQIFFDAEGNELFRHEGFYSTQEILDQWRALGLAVP